MVIIGLLLAFGVLIIAAIVSALIEIMSVVFIAVGIISLDKDRKQEREHKALYPGIPYKRRVYPVVLIAIGAAVQLWYMLMGLLGCIGEFIGFIADTADKIMSLI